MMFSNILISSRLLVFQASFVEQSWARRLLRLILFYNLRRKFWMSVSCSKCTVRFPCTVFVLFGILLLVGGSCVILIWAFVPNFSQAYPIGLQVGAVTCGSGVMVVISALITIYRWHSKMSRGATPGSTIHRKHGSHIIGKTHEVSPPCSYTHSFFPNPRRLFSLGGVFLFRGSCLK